MTVRRHLAVSVVAAAALLTSGVTSVPTIGVTAKAQQTEGKASGGANRADPPGKAGPPSRASPPTVDRAPARIPSATVDPSSQQRTIRREGAGTPNRVVIRDSDRRRGDGWRGDGWRGDEDGRRGDGDRRRGTRYVWGPGLAFYFYDGFYHGDCSWLRRKARETGSSYWRKRYAQCRDE